MELTEKERENLQKWLNELGQSITDIRNGKGYWETKLSYSYGYLVGMFGLELASDYLVAVESER